MTDRKFDLSHIAPTYGGCMGNQRFYPVALATGEGARVVGYDGKKYIDMIAGLGVNALGHNHPNIIELEKRDRKEKRLSHVSNLFIIPEQIEYANLLAGEFPIPDVQFFFCNSGAEANEAVLKANSKNSNNGKSIACIKGSFHGRYGVSNACTAQAAYNRQRNDKKTRWKTNYRKIIELERNNLKAVEKITPQVFAFIYEPIQAEFGIYEMSPEFIHAMRQRCNETGTIMIADEVQTGFGRTGKLFASEHYSSEDLPDAITMAKAIGAGEAVAMGAVGFGKKANLFVPGEHASTFGGNPKACRYATVALRTILDEGLIKNASALELMFYERKFEKLPVVMGTRGKGLLLGVELHPETKAKDVIYRCLDEGVIFGPAENNTIRIEPPLVITDLEFKKALGILYKILERC